MRTNDNTGKFCAVIKLRFECMKMGILLDFLNILIKLLLITATQWCVLTNSDLTKNVHYYYTCQ